MRRVLGFALALLLAACAGEPPIPTATATRPVPTPAPTPTHSMEIIEATWRDTDSLARTHLLADDSLTCEACHLDAPRNIDAPDDAVCLDCHEGSITRLVAMTNAIDEDIHPQGHLGQTSCVFCHTGHEPFQDPCRMCH